MKRVRRGFEGAMKALHAIVVALALMWAEGTAAWMEEGRGEPTVCDDSSCRCDPFSRVICNCTKEYDEVTIRPVGPYRMLPAATAVIIDGCARVYFFPFSINGTIQMRNIELRNVRHVDFKESSMLWSPYSREHELTNPGLRILIDNCTVDNIASHSFKGRVDDIVIRNSRIKSLQPYAFSSLAGVNNIELTNNEFENIEIHTFKKFMMTNFVLRGGSAKHFPSRFLSDIEVDEIFRIDGIHAGTIQSNAFIVNGPKRTTIENNAIGIIEGEAFRVVARGPFTFRNNTVGDIRRGAFLGISVSRQVVDRFGPQELLIDNNTVTDARIDSFHHNRSGLQLRIDGLNLAQPCECALGDVWLDVIAAQGGTIACNYTLEEHFVSLPTYVDSRCGQFKEIFWIIIAVVVVLALLIGAIIVFVVVRREKEKRKKLKVVMPDGKTYRETELHVIVERAELLTTDL